MLQIRRSIGITIAIVGLLFWGNIDVLAKSSLRVSEGQTFIVTEKEMLVDEWIMEDNSTVEIGQNITTWTIHAVKAYFGNNVKIMGVGSHGKDGASSTSPGGDVGECKNGIEGGKGSPGSDGGDGVNVKITMGLISVNSLMIDVHGGNGGNGGDGADGGRGGRASCGRMCSGQEGGNGGRGGNAGHSGSGGNVTIDYWVAGKNPISLNSSGNKGLRVNADGGHPGKVGQGGREGGGGAGKRCVPFIKRGSGSPGRRGANGDAGQEGKQGEITFTVLPSPK